MRLEHIKKVQTPVRPNVSLWVREVRDSFSGESGYMATLKTLGAVRQNSHVYDCPREAIDELLGKLEERYRELTEVEG